MEGFAKSGVKSLQVLCPGFSADCLETLEEIAMEDRDIFIEAGGERFEYIPCLNDDAEHIAMLAGLVDQHTQGWGPSLENPSDVLKRAIALGATQ